MNAKLSLLRTAALVASALLPLTPGRATESDALPTFDSNFLTLSGAMPWVNGSSAAFQKRAQYSHDGAGGIESFNYTQDFSKDTSYQFDGHLLPGSGDYLGQIKLVKNEVGSFEAGYKRFRTFYDGAGGFFPTNNAWLSIFPRNRYVDRAKFFLNATVELPKQPVFTFKYTNELRNGTKDSTIWGDSDATGIPIYSLSSLNPVTATRKILPAYLQLGERTQEWEASVRHTVGHTTATLSLIGTRIDNLDSRNVDRYTGELKPFPAIPSNPPTLVAPALANNPNHGFDVHGFKESALTWLGKIETKLSEAATTYADVSFRHATGDIVDSRLITATINTGTGVQNLVGGYTSGGRPPYSYTSTGTIKSDVLTGVVGVRLNPTKDFEADFALRGEDAKFTSNAYANYVSTLLVQATGVTTPVPVGGPNSSKIREKPWTPALDLNYAGIPNLALYGSWDYRTLTQDERTNYLAFTVNTTNGTLTGPVTPATDNIKEHHTNLKLGANWTPARFFNLRTEFFSKDHENRFEGYGVSAGRFYILDYDIYGAKVTAVAKVLPTLTLNTRYIVQRGKASTVEDAFAKSDANDSRRYQIGETIDWSPNRSLYVQASANLVYDTIRTSNPRVTGLAQTVVANADNNYWNGSLLAGFVVDKATDAQIQGSLYRAKNYQPAYATYALPFGASGKESTISVGVKHKFSDRMVGTAKVGYFDSQNDTAGGNANFRGPLVALSLQYKL